MNHLRIPNSLDVRRILPLTAITLQYLHAHKWCLHCSPTTISNFRTFCTTEMEFRVEMGRLGMLEGHAGFIWELMADTEATDDW